MSDAATTLPARGSPSSSASSPNMSPVARRVSRNSPYGVGRRTSTEPLWMK